MTQEKHIVYETKNFWILEKSTSYELYKNGITHSTRCGIFGKTESYLQRAIDNCNKREADLCKQ